MIHPRNQRIGPCGADLDELFLWFLLQKDRRLFADRTLYTCMPDPCKIFGNIFCHAFQAEQIPRLVLNINISQRTPFNPKVHECPQKIPVRQRIRKLIH